MPSASLVWKSLAPAEGEGGATDEELEAAVRAVWGGRADRYSDLRSAATKDLDKVEMSYIGG